jgi:sterol desaturase/sphingolipid hydroxylase (fatty acid hydroxylase superfamily)
LALGYISSKGLGTVIHYLLHQKFLYQWLHKKHHLPMYQLSPTSAWYATSIEFILLEIPGSFLFGTLIFPI